MMDTKTRGAYRVEGEKENKKRPVWLWLLAALALLALLLWALSTWNTDTDTTRTGGSARSENGSSSGVSGGASGSGSQPDSTTGGGSLSAGGSPLLPLAQSTSADGDLSSYAGKAVRSTGIEVVSVPADEGFWVGSSQRDRVWVQLVGDASESDYRVTKGDTVVFNGTVVPHNAGFAEQVGVDSVEGADQLDGAKAHLEVEKASVELAR